MINNTKYELNDTLFVIGMSMAFMYVIHRSADEILGINFEK